MTACNRCDWRPDRNLIDDHDQRIPARTQLVWHAADKAHPLCIVDGASLTEHEPQCCETCLTATRADLALIVTLYAELPAHLGQPSGQSFGRRGGDEHALPGGTVMAMLGPGSDGGRARPLTRLDRRRKLDGREHQADNLPGDPSSVAWLLGSWALDWAEIRGEGAHWQGYGSHPTPNTVPAIAGYLEVHCRWAANTLHDDTFAHFAAEMRSLRLALEDVTGRTRKPTQAGARCFRCGNDLLRLVNPDTGLEDDHVTCSGCWESYDPARYALALKAAAEATSCITVDGEEYATPEALGRELDRSAHTLRVWAQRDGLCRWVLRGGVVFVHVAGVTAAHEERKTRRRTA